MLSANAGLITTINANGRIILIMAAILSVSGIIHLIPNKRQFSSTKFQTSTKSQTSAKTVGVRNLEFENWNLFAIWILRVGSCL
jgi:hypothetical protein